MSNQIYDISKKFNTFYKKHVVLSREDRNRLFSKKNLNIERLKEGLTDYNKENGTSYNIVDTVVQGSVAMGTVTQNEEKDYDIDVAIIFDKGNIPEGNIAVKNIVVNALKRKCTGFKEEPTAKTNCARIVYADGYHIDFAIYRRYLDEFGNYKYEHCGSEWRARDPRAITSWFNQENINKNYRLRNVVRLLKMFCKSRDDWSMPGGLIQSVLANEQFQDHTRVDEMFYYTICAIKDRLTWNEEVYNPADEGQDLKLTKNDSTRMTNLHSRLNKYIKKLSVLFQDDCDEKMALKAWGEFFNHPYWHAETEKLSKSYTARSHVHEMENRENDYDYEYKETEEFIEYMFPVDIKYIVHLDCKVTQKGWRPFYLKSFLSDPSNRLMPNKDLKFTMRTDTPHPYDIYWKVKNKGLISKKRDQIRGQIQKIDSNTKTEKTNFRGEHYVECYIVQKGICVGIGRIEVPITT